MPLFKDDESTNTTISFRLPEQIHALICGYAEAAGITKHAAAKLILIAALDSREQRKRWPRWRRFPANWTRHKVR